MKNLRALFACLCLLLTSCGLHPIYGNWGSAQDVAPIMARIQIATIPTEQGQILRNHLIDRMYKNSQPENPLYRLIVTLSITEKNVGLLKNGVNTRSQIDITAQYSLHNVLDQKVFSGTAHSVTSFNRPDDQYATLAAEQSGKARGATEVGEQITASLQAFLASYRPDAPDQDKNQK